MDKDRQQAKEAVKGLPFGKKIKHYLYYYKFHIIVTVIALSLLGLYLYQRQAQVDYDVSISFFSKEVVTVKAEEAAEAKLSDLISSDGNKLSAEINIVSVPDLREDNSEQISAAYTKLDGQLAAGTVHALIMEEFVYESVMSEADYSSIMMEEYSFELGENAKKALGINKDLKYYYVTRMLYENEKGDEAAEAKHKNAIKVYEKLKELK